MQALRRSPVVVLGLALVVSGGAAIGIAAALDGDTSEATPRAHDRPAPVVAPVATGDTPPAAAAAEDGGGAMSRVVGASAAGRSGPSGTGTGAGERDGDADDAASGADGDARPDTDRVTILTDECAGPEPGAEPADDCPDGTGATVLALTDPSPQWIRFFPRDWSTRCPSVPHEAGDLRAIVATLNPGTMRLEYWPTDDPDMVTTVTRSTVSESDPEHQLWREWLEAGTLGTGAGRYVQYCLVLRDLPRGSYTWRATSQDIFESTATAHGEFEYASRGRPRPPVTITPRDETHVVVRVPLRSATEDGRREFVYVATVPRRGLDASTCSEREADGVYAALGSSGQRGVRVRPPGERSEDYPWNPAYDRVYTERLTLDEGTTTSICVWWGLARQRSFDADSITEREEHAVTTPNRYRARVSVERLVLRRPVEPGDVRVTPPDFSGRGDCPYQYHLFPDAGAIPAGDLPWVIEPRLVICDLTDVGDTASIGPTIDVSISGVPDGPNLTTSLDISRRPCNGAGMCEPVHTDWYRLNIPAERATECFLGRLCPHDTTVGSALIRVDLVDGPGEGGDDYAFGEPASFTAADVEEPPPPPYPQLDILGSRVAPIPDRHDALSVDVILDRPATVRAVASAPPCLRPGASGSAESTEPAHFASLVVEGLCAGHGYWFTLEMTDPAGTVSYATDVHRQADVPEPRMVWVDNWAVVPAYRVAATAQMRIVALPGTTGPAAPANRIYFWNAHVSLDGERVGTDRVWSFGDVSPWSPPVVDCSAAAPAEGPWVYRLSEASEHVVSNDVELAVDVDAASAFEGCGERGPRGQTSLRVTVPTEELLRGPVTLTSPAGDDLRVEVTITAVGR